MKIVLILFTALVLSCGGQADRKKENNMPQHTNRLIKETSPYLRQHAHNPVDWYPWGEEAFAKARAEDKPILLSIGYAACHWCHVMEKESFENEEIAALMNDLFVNIKVDREERPDVDQLYMRYVQLLTGSGGWPMTVFLTPDLKPFYGGTYFPPEDRYGRPGFRRLLRLVAGYYHGQKEDLAKNLQKIEEAISETLRETRGRNLPDDRTFNRACQRLAQMYEPQYGGLGSAPKFPAVQALQLFLRHYDRSGEKRYLDMVTHTLDHMARGGIYDQLGGGFARYATDNAWLVPHFEKMLYDNAQLVNLYLDAYLLTRDDFYLDIVRETLAFVEREMTDALGGFYSSFDADSEGEEGRFYTWEHGEIMRILGPEAGEVFCARYGVTPQGNFEGRNILHITADIGQLARRFGKTNDEIVRVLETGKQRLFRQRQKRVAPALDDKVLLSWNALMLSAYARAFQVTRDPAYGRVIRRHIAFMQNTMRDGGRLLHTWKDGTAKQPAFLDDYAYWIQALLDSYEALFEPEWLAWAERLTDKVNSLFWDAENGGYFYTADQQGLIHRLKDETDQSVPSATGIMLMNMLRLYSVTENRAYIDRTEEAFRKYEPALAQNPYGYASHLNALDFYLRKPQEILLVNEGGADPEELLKVIFERYLPNKVLLLSGGPTQSDAMRPSVFRGRAAQNNKPTVYVCRNFVCSLPVTDPSSLRRLLQN